MKLSIAQIDYKVQNYSTPTLRIFGRDENGERRIKYVSGVEPYLYTKDSDIIGMKDSRVTRVENGPPTLTGDKTVKVFCNIPSEVAGKDANYLYLRDLFKWSGEADILFSSRAKIDYNLSGVIECPEKTFVNIKDIKLGKAKINFRKQFIDIETIGSTIHGAIKGEAQIPCLTLYDNYLETYFLFTTIQLNHNDIESIKAKIHDFWVTSLDKLKASLLTEKEEEKAKAIEKQIKYLENNLPRILDFKLSVKTALSESEMLLDYINFRVNNRTDLTLGWNSKKFDEVVILNRMKNLKLPYQQLSDVGEAFATKSSDECVISGVVLMDLMTNYVGMQQATPSHRGLDFISKKELGVGKLLVRGHALYTSDPTTYLAYNIVDVALCYELDRLLHIVDFYVEIANMTNSNLSDTSRSTYIDNLILTYCHNVYALPTRASIDVKRMSGAVVYMPEPGLHKNCLLLDFSSMYPSIMMSLNISPETKSPTGDIIAANGVRFDSKRIGIIPFILKSLKEKRADIKKMMKEAEKIGDMILYHEYDLKQYAVKVISNAFYGVLGFKKFRLADSDVGDSVTSTGRMLSLTVKAFVEAKGYKIIFGDTDSLVFEIPGTVTYNEIINIGKTLEKEINDYLPTILKQKFNSDTCYCKIEADSPYHTLVMLPKKSIGKNEEEVQAKKRYAGYVWKGENKYEFKVKGLEYVKGNTADITRYVQEKLLKYVLDSTDTTAISKFLKSLYDDFFSNAFPIEQIGKPTSLRMPLSEYLTDNPAKRAAEFSNRYLNKEYEDGSSFVLYHLKDATTDVIALDYAEPLPSQYHIDMQETWNKLIFSPTETILQTRNLNWNDIISGTTYIQGQETMLDTTPQQIIILIQTPPAPKVSEMDLFL